LNPSQETPRPSWCPKLVTGLDLNLNNVGCESLFTEIPTSSGIPFIIGVIYRHPTYASQPLQDEFVKLVTHLQNNNYDYLIGGDYNINLIKYQENSNVSNYVDCRASCGCISLINKPTRFSKNSKTSLIDHTQIFVMKKNN